MGMPKPYTTFLGKAVRSVARMRGGGSALPGLFVEKIDPDFVRHALAGLEHGVVIVSGTNGKTTTTKMVVELLESQGLRVFTNRTGSNFVRGVAAALLGEVDRKGRLDCDIAVLELDEAHAVHFVKTIQPRYALLLNVMRDQLDRFGEIDTTARMLHTIATHTTDGIVLNRDDPRLSSEAFRVGLSTALITTYGTSRELQAQFPSDDDMRGAAVGINPPSDPFMRDDTSLELIENRTATIHYDGTDHTASLQLSGVYNILNATAAVALVRAVQKDKLDETAMLAALERVTPAFGRGESLTVDGQPCELVLVKNPAGFRLSLQSFDAAGHATMLAINDNYADGRDMSWLWDVDFDSLKSEGVAAITGIRAFDMALRLQYDDIPISHVEPKLSSGLKTFLKSNPDQPKRIYCTYTAMLSLRRELAKITDVREVA